MNVLDIKFSPLQKHFFARFPKSVTKYKKNKTQIQINHVNIVACQGKSSNDSNISPISWFALKKKQNRPRINSDNDPTSAVLSRAFWTLSTEENHSPASFKRQNNVRQNTFLRANSVSRMAPISRRCPNLNWASWRATTKIRRERNNNELIMFDKHALIRILRFLLWVGGMHTVVTFCRNRTPNYNGSGRSDRQKKSPPPRQIRLWGPIMCGWLLLRFLELFGKVQ